MRSFLVCEAPMPAGPFVIRPRYAAHAFCGRSRVTLVSHMLDIEFGQATHPGKVRENNEDASGFYCPRSPQEARARGWLFVLADGVGGLDLGEVASATDHFVSP